MAAPIRPTPSAPIDPCRVCGSPVTMRTEMASRRLGETTGREEEIRHCTKPDCNTNAGRNRRMGAKP